MVFKVESFNKGLDMFNVISDTGEQKYVTSYQIIQVMVNGYQFLNAYLTKKGFAIKTDRGTRYIQVDMPKDLALAVKNKIEFDKQVADNMKNQQVKTVGKVRAKAKVAVGTNRQTSKLEESSTIIHRGTRYLSDIHLCKKYNRDINTFRSLYSKGYSVDEALGLRELRPEAEVIAERKRTLGMLDSMARGRGE